jgi:hypothetical protein
MLEPLVFGTNDRVEYRAISDAADRTLAGATAALVHQMIIQCGTDGWCTIGHSTPSPPYCDGSFAHDGLAPYCTAFLTGRDVVTTARHCTVISAVDNWGQHEVPVEEDARVVFGWVLDAQGNPPTRIHSSSIYRISAVLNPPHDADVQMLRLERPVSGANGSSSGRRKPLRSNLVGGIGIQGYTPLVSFGHPAGATLKMISKGNTLPIPAFYASSPYYLNYDRLFQTNIDSIEGQSGSAVVNRTTGLVEGVLVSMVSSAFVTLGQPDGSWCVLESHLPDEGDPEPGAQAVYRGAEAVAMGHALAYCRNGAKDIDETDVDCGSSCAPCALGESCRFGEDCASGGCQNGVCTALCSDGIRSGTESDVDCGGSCATLCAVGARCTSPYDCATGVCLVNYCRNFSCVDGMRDGAETGIDCGGPCSPCAP